MSVHNTSLCPQALGATLSLLEDKRQLAFAFFKQWLTIGILTMHPSPSSSNRFEGHIGTRMFVAIVLFSSSDQGPPRKWQSSLTERAVPSTNFQGNLSGNLRIGSPHVGKCARINIRMSRCKVMRSKLAELTPSS